MMPTYSNSTNHALINQARRRMKITGENLTAATAGLVATDTGHAADADQQERWVHVDRRGFDVQRPGIRWLDTDNTPLPVPVAQVRKNSYPPVLHPSKCGASDGFPRQGGDSLLMVAPREVDGEPVWLAVNLYSALLLDTPTPPFPFSLGLGSWHQGRLFRQNVNTLLLNDPVEAPLDCFRVAGDDRAAGAELALRTFRLTLSPTVWRAHEAAIRMAVGRVAADWEHTPTMACVVEQLERAGVQLPLGSPLLFGQRATGRRMPDSDGNWTSPSGDPWESDVVVNLLAPGMVYGAHPVIDLPQHCSVNRTGHIVATLLLDNPDTEIHLAYREAGPQVDLPEQVHVADTTEQVHQLVRDLPERQRGGSRHPVVLIVASDAWYNKPTLREDMDMLIRMGRSIGISVIILNRGPVNPIQQQLTQDHILTPIRLPIVDDIEVAGRDSTSHDLVVHDDGTWEVTCTPWRSGGYPLCRVDAQGCATTGAGMGGMDWACDDDGNWSHHTLDGILHQHPNSDVCQHVRAAQGYAADPDYWRKVTGTPLEPGVHWLSRGKLEEYLPLD